MAVTGTNYVPVRPKQYPKSRDALSVDARFWRSFKALPPSQQIGAVTCIHFCSTPPHDFAVTSSTRITVYDGKTCEVKKTISRFTDVAYSGTFRADGQLIVAGGETGVIQVFDAGSRTVLRQMKGHTRAVHWVRYSLQDKLHVLSASDDNSVRWWDVASQEQLLKMEEHTDYVRCGTSSPASADLWATGSYDHSVRVWDVRTRKSIVQLQHGAPLEDVIFFASGGVLASAGGNIVKIWDVLSGKLLHALGNHQKTVTKLCLTTPEVPGSSVTDASPRLLSASLDGHVRVFELDKFKVTHVAKYPDPLLSMDLSPTCTTMAVGMSSGRLTIRKCSRVTVGEDATSIVPSKLPPLGGDVITKKERRLNPNNYRYFLRGRSEKASDNDYFVARLRRPTLAKYDKFLKSFHYKDALIAALSTSDPTVVVAVMEELVARSGLMSGLSNWDAPDVEVLLSFLSKHTTHPRYSRLLIPLAHKVIDLYAPVFGSSQSFRRLMSLFKERVALEAKLQISLQALQGIIQPLIQASVQS